MSLCRKILTKIGDNSWIWMKIDPFFLFNRL